MTSYYITKLENIIRRIFNSIDSIGAKDILVTYLGEKSFDKEVIDQRCFQFQKSNSDFLFFELLLPEKDEKAHSIEIEHFMEQIMYKYNVENIACFIHHGHETDKDHQSNFTKEHIFEVTCLGKNSAHKVYVNIDPEEFFS